LIGVSVLVATTGVAETIMTAQDYAVDSDVMLESALDTVKSIPQDTVNVVGDAVKFVSDEVVTATKGVKAAFEKDPVKAVKKAAAIETAKAWDSSSEVIFRSFKLATTVGGALVAGGMATNENLAIDVSGFFDGIEFPEGTSAYYRPDFRRLFVCNTLDRILDIEDVLAELHNANRKLRGHQVEIEAKFLEVSQTTMEELDFGWRFSSKGGGDASLFDDLSLDSGQDLFTSGLRTAASALSTAVSADTLTLSRATGSLQWDLIISALEQAEDTEVLCAPRLVTRDGNTATIQVGERQMLPKAFDVNSSDTGPFIEHTDWDEELLGVRLEVTPELREGNLIDLEIVSRIWEIIGYDEYTVSMGGLNNDGFSGDYWSGIFQNTGIENAQVATLPYVRTREMSTMMTVADGGTVGMGGLIYDKLETFRDKVPVLGSIPLIGRLFRSEGENSVKRNLTMFVTARQVDVNGRTVADTALNK
jgi:general secretion pathway protein D